MLKAITQQKQAAAPARPAAPPAAKPAVAPAPAGRQDLRRRLLRRLRQRRLPAAACDTGSEARRRLRLLRGPKWLPPAADKPAAPVAADCDSSAGADQRLPRCGRSAVAGRRHRQRRRGSAASSPASPLGHAPLLRRAASGGCRQRPPQPPVRSGAADSRLPPRMIVPQTGPRPVYTAPPPRPAAPTAHGAPRRDHASCARTSSAGPANFPASASAGGARREARPPLRPGERRPMHPTRSAPTGARPLGVGPGAVAAAGTSPSRQPVRALLRAGPDSAMFRVA